MSIEPTPKFTVREMQLEDIEPATAMRLRSWLDTYVNDEVGVTREWIERRNQEQMLSEKIASRRERFTRSKQANTMNAWVACDAEGSIVGSTTPYRDDEGKWHLGSLYVDKTWHGTGVGGELMRRAMDWIGVDNDVHLGVVSYNERAKAFYRKWSFEEVPNSSTLFDDKIPEVKMIRKARKDDEARS